ncbi:hypothetical protein L6452_18703 [Arctium lappa]|uniref:Uncharacterized protein n=1 Tax=Arctium lappa TaxID=4217 RepID=A0ACB9C6X1_ARCLA|nr:hypothetical protein L6452_18703 [Arctium lappa]
MSPFADLARGSLRNRKPHFACHSGNANFYFALLTGNANLNFAFYIGNANLNFALLTGNAILNFAFYTGNANLNFALLCVSLLLDQSTIRVSRSKLRFKLCVSRLRLKMMNFAFHVSNARYTLRF